MMYDLKIRKPRKIHNDGLLNKNFAISALGLEKLIEAYRDKTLTVYKYKNRKYYIKREHRRLGGYVTLEQVDKLLGEGLSLKLVCNVTKIDLTHTLAMIVQIHKLNLARKNNDFSKVSRVAL